MIGFAIYLVGYKFMQAGELIHKTITGKVISLQPKADIIEWCPVAIAA